MNNENVKKPEGLLEVGRVYTLENFKPEEVELAVVPRQGSNVFTMANEILTVSKYATDEKSMTDMIIRIMNTHLTANVAFPKVTVVDTTPAETEAETVPAQ